MRMGGYHSARRRTRSLSGLGPRRGAPRGAPVPTDHFIFCPSAPPIPPVRTVIRGARITRSRLTSPGASRIIAVSPLPRRDARSSPATRWRHHPASRCGASSASAAPRPLGTHPSRPPSAARPGAGGRSTCQDRVYNVPRNMHPLAPPFTSVVRGSRVYKSYCGQPDCPGRRACRACKNIYSRATRIKHRDLPEAQRLKANCRAATKMLVRRGLLKKGSCEDCQGTTAIQSHHDDYTKPWQVRWKCRSCHRTFHRAQSVVD